LVSNIDPTTARTGKWTADEDKKLKGAVPTQGAKNWVTIAALVPGRTKKQCCNRWHDVLVSTIDSMTARTGIWTADEDNKLKGAVHAHGDKNWERIAALVLGPTKRQCRKRWWDAF
jgi:myb proto-oncogene protein